MILKKRKIDYQRDSNLYEELKYFLSPVLIKLITDYEKIIPLHSTFDSQFELPREHNSPFGIASDHKYLYITDPIFHGLYIYTLTGQYIRSVQFTLRSNTHNFIPRGIEIKK